MDGEPIKPPPRQTAVKGWTSFSEIPQLSTMLRSPDMMRKRSWSNREEISSDGKRIKIEGERLFLGTHAADNIEDILRRGGVVWEIGAGRLSASKELALKFPQGKVVAQEAEPDDRDFVELPQNMRRIPSDVEHMSLESFLGWRPDAAFSILVLPYPQDKLLFLKKVYEMLSSGGKAFHYVLSSPTDPPLDTIARRLGWENRLEAQVTKLGLLVIMTKGEDELDLSNARFTEAQPDGNLKGAFISHYIL